jgi:hypothetical protein
MRSDRMKRGFEKAPHRALFKAMGYTDSEIARPIVGVVNSHNEIVPGHVHLDTIADAVKAGIRIMGGTPVEFPTIAVCDGIAMNHEGMKYSLASRELIADSIEVMAAAHPFDALVMIPSCDKVVPGMLMAALRINVPTIVISGGPMMAGIYGGREVDLVTVFEGVGKLAVGAMTEEELVELENAAVRRDVHRKLHELPDGGRRHGVARQRDDPRGGSRAHQARQRDRKGRHEARRKGDTPARHHYGDVDQERGGRRHGPELLHQYGPPPAGDRLGGGDRA